MSVVSYRNNVSFLNYYLVRMVVLLIPPCDSLAVSGTISLAWDIGLYKRQQGELNVNMHTSTVLCS